MKGSGTATDLRGQIELRSTARDGWLNNCRARSTTTDILTRILEDELEREEDLEGLLNDLEELMKR